MLDLSTYLYSLQNKLQKVLHFQEVKQILSCFAPCEKVRETQHIPHNLSDCSQNHGQATFSCPGCGGVVTSRAVIHPELWDLALLLPAISPRIFRLLSGTLWAL